MSVYRPLTNETPDQRALRELQATHMRLVRDYARMCRREREASARLSDLQSAVTIAAFVALYVAGGLLLWGWM